MKKNIWERIRLDEAATHEQIARIREELGSHERHLDEIALFRAMFSIYTRTVPEAGAIPLNPGDLLTTHSDDGSSHPEALPAVLDPALDGKDREQRLAIKDRLFGR